MFVLCKFECLGSANILISNPGHSSCTHFLSSRSSRLDVFFSSAKSVTLAFVTKVLQLECPLGRCLRLPHLGIVGKEFIEKSHRVLELQDQKHKYHCSRPRAKCILGQGQVLKNPLEQRLLTILLFVQQGRQTLYSPETPSEVSNMTETNRGE